MELNIRIAGEAGQGLQTVGDLVGKAITRSALYAYSYNDAESRIRGGLNFVHMRISDNLSMGVTNRVDILVALTERALETLGDGISEGGLVITAKDWEHPKRARFMLLQIAEEAGSAKTISTVAFSSLSALMGLDREIVDDLVRENFGGDKKLTEMNMKAASLGYDAGAEHKGGVRFRMPKADSDIDRLWLSGGDAISLGAVAGGVSFISAYPMSPATSIMTNLAQWSHETGVIVEQAEDEIAAINMVAGASYAGARAMTATSGGGFALMAEGLSNIGMIEVPAVIVLAQRPGPATGLPTRTAQGDLNFVRFAGHGNFARVLIAPQNIQDCFEAAANAFDIAERYQVPVIILTDQLMQDSYATVDPFVTDGLPATRYFLGSKELSAMDVYRRYQQTETGISPIAAPGVSKHPVVVDSDEHDEDGHMVESAKLADRMARKRLRKALTLEADVAVLPDVFGDSFEIPLVVSWGSTFESVVEARQILKSRGEEFAHMNLRTLWPLPEDALLGIINGASILITVENSVGCEIDSLLREMSLRKANARITKMDGRPFTVEELVEKIGEAIK